MKIQVTSIPRNPGGEVVPRLLGVVGASIRTTAILEKGDPFRESSPQHSVNTKGFVPCASQPVGPSSLRTALVAPPKVKSGRLDGPLESLDKFWISPRPFQSLYVLPGQQEVGRAGGLS